MHACSTGEPLEAVSHMHTFGQRGKNSHHRITACCRGHHARCCTLAPSLPAARVLHPHRRLEVSWGSGGVGARGSTSTYVRADAAIRDVREPWSAGLATRGRYRTSGLGLGQGQNSIEDDARMLWEDEWRRRVPHRRAPTYLQHGWICTCQGWHRRSPHGV